MKREELIKCIEDYAGDDFDSADPKQVSFLRFTVDDAIEEVCNEMYPYGVMDNDKRDCIRQIALSRYGHVIRRIAMFHYDKQGKEGVTTFYESGQTTSYGGGGTPREYLNCIVPIAKIV